MLGSDLYFTLPVWAQERVLGLRGLTRKLLREGGPNLMEMPEPELYARACKHEWTFACSTRTVSR